MGWAEAGQPYELFWDLTLREVSMIIDGVTRRRKADANAMLAAAWHTEAFARSKKLPRLKAILQDGGERETRRQTPEQIEAVLRSILSKRKR